MIEDKKKIKLTKQSILDRVTEYDILRAFWPLGGRKLEIGHPILSPFRPERNPSFIIRIVEGRVFFKDMGDLRYRGNIWDFVQMIERASGLDDILTLIDERLMLGISKGGAVERSPIITWEQPKRNMKPPPKIDVITRSYNQDELTWWNMYFQDKEDLKREEIYVPKYIYRDGSRIPMVKNDLVFCYYYRGINKWKIYRPLRSSKGKNIPVYERKWDTDCPIDFIEHLDKINGCKYAFISKARKDRMVLRKALETDCICTLHAEDPSCFSDEALIHIEHNSDVQVSVLDNDEKGKQVSWWLTNDHGYKHCNVPDFLRKREITDFSDWAREEKNLTVVTNHFKQKGFI